MGSTAWHALTADEVLERLSVGHEGLSPEEARERLAKYGPNELVESEKRSPVAMFIDQFKDVMIGVLIVAAIISALIGEVQDSIVIGIILILNAVLGFVQEYRAEQAMAALKRMSVPTVRVTRGGHVVEINSRELVPGDILHLETGSQVAADARLIENFNLRVEEAALTGESVPVEKDVDPVGDENTPLGDRRSMVFMGTAINAGRGLGVVVNTGMQTELGHIATMIQSGEERKTPLQIRLAHLGKVLAAVALAICAVVFAAGVLRGDDPGEMFLTAVSLAVAAVPESLPAVITVSLALGAQRMVRRHALIRKLPAVETLGCVTTICSDKTGTLTENKMMVTGLYVDGTAVAVTGSGYRPEGQLLVGDKPISVGDNPQVDLAIRGMLLCNDAILAEPENGRDWHIVGDPTEGAMVVLAAKAGLNKESIEKTAPRVAELGFDSDRKRMTTFHRLDGKVTAFTKGAVDVMIGLCSGILRNGQVQPLTEADRAEILAQNDKLAAEGQRVLAIAYREWDECPEKPTVEEHERDLVYLGMVTMIDPPRAEAKDAVAVCRRAGIKPVMITGDHRLTAQAIARQIGILEPGGRSVPGTELDQMTDEELARQVESISVYSRVSPLHKMRVVEALQSKGQVVAMTGDGVNDAPALKRADIGVAMGITGTDVSKEASDMVLTDDNFATIVAAVSEGRAIYDNIRKFIRYMLTTNSAEVLTMFGSVLAGLPLPLLPIQILWINLVTDGLPALGLSFEPAERHIMHRPPRPATESVFARGMGVNIVWMGLWMAVSTLGMMVWALNNGYELIEARTMVFFTLASYQVCFVMAIRSERESLFRQGLRSNSFLSIAVALTFVAQLAVIYVPFLQPIFDTVALPADHLAIAFGVSFTGFVFAEIQKLIIRMREPDVDTDDELNAVLQRP